MHVSASVRARRGWAAALTLLVSLGLVGALPTSAQAIETQVLTVETTGLPASSSVALYRYNVDEGRVYYDQDETIDGAGRVTFETTPGGVYTLRAYGTATTFDQYLGGGTDVYGAPRFSAPVDGAAFTQQFAVTAAAFVQGQVTVPPGTIADAWVRAYEWDSFDEAWDSVTVADVGVGGFQLKLRPGKTYTLRASGSRSDDVSFVPVWLGGSTESSPSFEGVESFVAPAGGQTVTGKTIALSTLYTNVNLTVTGIPTGDEAEITLYNLGDDSSYWDSVTSSSPTTTIQVVPGTYLATARSTGLAQSQIVTVTQTGTATTLDLAAATSAVNLRARVTGSSRVGSTATVKTEVTTPLTGATVTSYWGVGGTLVATGPTFTVPKTALGKSITVRTIATAPGHRAGVHTWDMDRGEIGDAPRPTAVPHILGAPKVGATSTLAVGTWDVAETAFSVQWTRDGADIPGAAATTYTATVADAGKTLGARITATATGHEVGTVTVTAATVTAPGAGVAFTAKTSGTAKVGSTLTASAAPTGWVAKYQWLRAGKTIKGATKRTYKAAGADAGKKVAVKVTLTRTGYTTVTSTSAATKSVTKASAKITAKSGKGKAKITVKATGVKAPTGKVTVSYGSKKVTATLKAKNKGVVTVKLPKGTHKVKVTYAGSSQVSKTTRKNIRVKVS